MYVVNGNRKQVFCANKYVRNSTATKSGSDCRPAEQGPGAPSDHKDEACASAKKLKLDSQRELECRDDIGEYLIINSLILG